MITQELVWTTSDGTRHSTEQAAWAHEAANNFRAWCRKNICGGGEWSADMVANEILEHFTVRFKV